MSNEIKYTVLFFGSFNPPHIGHTAVARYVAEQPWCEQLWMIVTPDNPLKDSASLAPEGERFEMTRLAVGAQCADLQVQISDVEFQMPRPSYTIDTLRKLESEYPERNFALLCGSDLPDTMNRWKEGGLLLNTYTIFVYPRPGYEMKVRRPNIIFIPGAPQSDLSSTSIREMVINGADITGKVCPKVADYIEKQKLWKK